MARLPRLVVPDQPHHVVQRGIDGQVMFRDESDHRKFLDWLRDAAKQFKVAVHAYVLLPNQIHLLLTPSDSFGLGRLMQWIGRYYVPYYNQKYHRSGTLWQGRYKATVIDAERYLITCSRFVELQPVQIHLVSDPVEYPWSSYAHHTGIKSDPVVVDHPLYWSLGNTPFDREIAYKNLCQQALTDDEMRALNNATLKGWALGSDKFKTNLEKKTGRRVAPIKPGRPSKQKKRL